MRANKKECVENVVTYDNFCFFRNNFSENYSNYLKLSLIFNE